MAFELLKTCLFSKINTMFMEVEKQINFIGAKSSGLKLATTGVVIMPFIITHREPKLELNIKVILHLRQLKNRKPKLGLSIKFNKKNCALQSYT